MIRSVTVSVDVGGTMTGHLLATGATLRGNPLLGKQAITLIIAVLLGNNSFNVNDIYIHI